MLGLKSIHVSKMGTWPSYPWIHMVPVVREMHQLIYIIIIIIIIICIIVL